MTRSGSISSVMLACRPSRDRPAAARTTASRSSVTRDNRVSTLPRMSTISRSGRATAIWARRRGEPVPTRAPTGKRRQGGSITGHQGVAGVLPRRDRRQVQARVRRGGQVLERVHRDVRPTVDDAPGGRPRRTRRFRRSAVSGAWSTSPRVVTSTSSRVRPVRAASCSPTIRDWAIARGERRVARRRGAAAASRALIAGPRPGRVRCAPVPGSRSANGSTTDAGSDGSRSNRADSASA